MEKRKKIMLVDDNLTNLTTGKNMLKDYFEVYPLPSAAKLFEFLESIIPDLILLDIEMPVINGYDTIKILKQDPRYADIPVIFLTALSGEMNELEGLELGAIDYVTKPFSAPLLMKRIENHLLLRQQKKELSEFNENLMKMVKEKTSEVIDLQNVVIHTVADLVECRDITTGGHILRTQEYMRVLVERLISKGVYTEETYQWSMEFFLASVPLHDVGKIAVSDTILNKPGKFTPEEFEIMKTHAEKGIEIIRRMENSGKSNDFLKHAEVIAGTHHERWDGGGYPAGLKGTDIPLEGRMMAIADVYDALISIRPYKKAFPAGEAARIIKEEAGSHFDPVLVDIFLELQDEFAAIAAGYNEMLAAAS